MTDSAVNNPGAVPADSARTSEQAKERGGILDRPAYYDQRRMLCEMACRSTHSFDQGMITLPAGALAISMTFIKDIAPNPQAGWLLMQGWACFGASLVLTLISLLTSYASLEKDKRELDLDQEREYSLKYRNRWSEITKVLNWLSIVAFVFGVYRVAEFVGANFH